MKLRALRGLSEFMHVRCIEQGLEQGKHTVSGVVVGVNCHCLLFIIVIMKTLI